jgi:hypothetical protein
VIGGISQETRDRLIYAFGHMVAEQNPDDPHGAASGELARETMIDLFDIDMDALDVDDEGMLAIGVMLVLAEHVAQDYTYTGEGTQ